MDGVGRTPAGPPADGPHGLPEACAVGPAPADLLPAVMVRVRLRAAQARPGRAGRSLTLPASLALLTVWVLGGILLRQGAVLGVLAAAAGRCLALLTTAAGVAATLAAAAAAAWLPLAAIGALVVLAEAALLPRFARSAPR